MRRAAALALSAAGLASLVGVGLYASGVQSPEPVAAAAVRIPAPSSDFREPGDSAVAVFAGGCFWGVEGVFEHVAGVRRVEAGYAGGSAADADYDRVSSGRTRHAEAVRITYDPRQVSYGQLLHIFFSVAHDPTQLNRQGPDHGPQYRSAIFPQSEGQRRAATGYIAQLDSSRRFRSRIATRLEQGGFWAAEAYHQNFMRRNPTHSYIVMHDAPKLRDLRATFPRLVTGRPAA